MSEDAAMKRIQAARAARRYPALFHAVAEGRLHLTAVCLIAPHLTEGNVQELILAATHRRKSEIQEWLAGRFTQAVAIPAASIRLLAASAVPGGSLGIFDGGAAVAAMEESNQHALEHVKSKTDVAHERQVSSGEDRSGPDPQMSTRVVRRFVVEVTIEESTHAKLRYAQALLSHAVSPKDVAQLLDRALDALIEKVEKRRFGVGGARRSCAAARSEGRSGDPQPSVGDAPEESAAAKLSEEMTRDVLAGLRGLGCRADEARRAAEFAARDRGATLEERIRVALKYLSSRRRGVPAATPPTPDGTVLSSGLDGAARRSRLGPGSRGTSTLEAAQHCGPSSCNRGSARAASP